jgi:hypothetical protein
VRQAFRVALWLAAALCVVLFVGKRFGANDLPDVPVTSALLVVMGLNGLLFSRENAEDTAHYHASWGWPYDRVDYHRWFFRLLGTIFVVVGMLVWFGLIRMKGMTD